VGHDSAENTSPVTSQEGDHELGALGVGVTWSSENVCVESADGPLPAPSSLPTWPQDPDL
jgi:hypothetical protein